MKNIIKRSLVILCLFGMTIAYAPPRGGGGGGGRSGARMGGMRSGGMGRGGGGGARMSGARMGGGRGGARIAGPRAGGAGRGIRGDAIRGTRRPDLSIRPGALDRARPDLSGAGLAGGRGGRSGRPGRDGRGGRGGRGDRRPGRDGGRRDGRRGGRRGDGRRRDGRHRRHHRGWGWWGPSAFWLGWPLLYPFAAYYSGPSYCYVINNAPYDITIQPYGFPTMTIAAQTQAAVPCVGGLINDISYVSSNQIVVGDDGGTIFISDDSDYE